MLDDYAAVYDEDIDGDYHVHLYASRMSRSTKTQIIGHP
jgi:hypothetical protein